MSRDFRSTLLSRDFSATQNKGQPAQSLAKSHDKEGLVWQIVLSLSGLVWFFHFWVEPRTERRSSSGEAPKLGTGPVLDQTPGPVCVRDRPDTFEPTAIDVDERLIRTLDTRRRLGFGGGVCGLFRTPGVQWGRLGHLGIDQDAWGPRGTYVVRSRHLSNPVPPVLSGELQTKDTESGCATEYSNRKTGARNNKRSERGGVRPEGPVESPEDRRRNDDEPRVHLGPDFAIYESFRSHDHVIKGAITPKGRDEVRYYLDSLRRATRDLDIPRRTERSRGTGATGRCGSVRA
ncbi:hypothetical protein BV22DRAFT_1051973 [Leucogyrophana mollusca]|uniref:Uncharacterized protein n=1 Tax=Leucogyrophana mollusca TaxID=85980 RepID=A0ACB8AYR4_9AGAM|nr:hypothetical protein BV22DRAFT_1051973 [Leucogyrophana mollusca]